MVAFQKYFACLLLAVVLVITVACKSKSVVDTEANPAELTPYAFTLQLLQTLLLLELGHYHYKERRQEANEPYDGLVTRAKILRSHMEMLNRYRDALKSAPQVNDDNKPNMKAVSQKLIKGIQGLITVNEEYLSVFKDPTNVKDPGYTLARLGVQQKEAWLHVLRAAGVFLPVVMGPPANENPTGALPYKMSPDERLQLLAQLQTYFGKTIKKYSQQITSAEKDPKKGTIDAIGLSILRVMQALAFDTYEEAKQAAIP